MSIYLLGCAINAIVILIANIKEIKNIRIIYSEQVLWTLFLISLSWFTIFSFIAITFVLHNNIKSKLEDEKYD